MKQILQQMFHGWKIREQSWDAETETYAVDEIDAYKEACGGDLATAIMLHYFDHWSNDIQSISECFGIKCDINAPNGWIDVNPVAIETINSPDNDPGELKDGVS